MSTSVARVSALIGLNERLPHSLSHISARMSSMTNDLKPARVSKSTSCWARSVREPSSSPMGKRLPSVWRTTPGDAISPAGKVTVPTMLSTGTLSARTPSGSSDCNLCPANGPPCFSKYHQGSPF